MDQSFEMIELLVSMRSDISLLKSEIIDLRRSISDGQREITKTRNGSRRLWDSDSSSSCDFNHNQEIHSMAAKQKLNKELRHRLNDVAFFEKIFLDNNCDFIFDIK